MTTEIHKTAIIDPKAVIDEGVSIGPFCIVGEGVKLKKGTRLMSNVMIEGNTEIGEGCQIYPFASIGLPPQDLKYKGEKTGVKIGNNNVIREYMTIHRGSVGGDGLTEIGNDNFLMAYVHVAHDCIVGNNCVIANNGTLAGHVTIEDKAVIGGLVAVHQFVRVGKLSIIGGCSKVVQDIPPFSTCDGHPARVYGLNLIGLRRHAIPPDSIKNLDRAFKILFGGGLSKKTALEQVAAQIKSTPEVAYLVNFMKSSERGVAGSCRK